MPSLASRLQDLKPLLILAYLSVMGFASAAAAQIYMGLPVDLMPCLSFMAVVFGVYTLNRFTDVQEDFTTDIGRLLWFRDKRGLLTAAFVCVGGSTVLLAALGKLNWMHLALLAIGCSYSYRMIPWWSRAEGFHLIRIKEMTFVKNLAVAFLWSGAVFLLPVLYAGRPIAATVPLILAAAGLCLSTFNNTLFDDILDEPGDRAAGITTLPTALGGKWAYVLLWGMDGIWLAGVAGAWMFGAIDAAHWGFLSLMGAYPLIYTALGRSGRLPKGWVEFIAESDLLLFTVGMAALSRVG